MATQYRYSFGPWNLSDGADPFGPAVREELPFAETCEIAQRLGFHGLQFHDDEAIPADMPADQLPKACAAVKQLLDDHGLVCEFVAPRFWFDPRTVDGPVTSNDPAERQYAKDRGKRAVDIARLMGTTDIVWWPAREGTYIRESKNALQSFEYQREFVNTLLAYDPEIRILGEMKPNEPMDLMYQPTTGHFLALCYKALDPTRCGVLIESAHCILAGLDPSDEMAYALWHDKLWSVHLNDQNGMKFDQDKTFGSVDLRRAFNQVRVLEQNDYQGWVGLDIKAMRTQPAEIAWKHLENSKVVFEALVELVRRIDPQEVQDYIDKRDYEALELFILKSLMGLR